VAGSSALTAIEEMVGRENPPVAQRPTMLIEEILHSFSRKLGVFIVSQFKVDALALPELNKETVDGKYRAS